MCSATICGDGDLRQYEVFDNPSRRARNVAPYVVIVQSHLLDGLPTAVASPLLVASHAERFAYLSVEVEFLGNKYVLSLFELATFDARPFRNALGDLDRYHDEIARGLQRLFSGF